MWFTLWFCLFLRGGLLSLGFGYWLGWLGVLARLRRGMVSAMMDDNPRNVTRR